MPTSQFHGSPGRGDGWNHPRCHYLEELWAETPRSDLMVDLPFYLSNLCVVCHLLEHFRLQPVGFEATSPSLNAQDRRLRRAEAVCQLHCTSQDGGSIFIFSLGEDGYFEHNGVWKKMLKDLTSEWTDQFVIKSSRYCNAGWPGPCSFFTARASTGHLEPGHLSHGLLAHINILYGIFPFSWSVLELQPVVELIFSILLNTRWEKEQSVTN